MRIVYLRAVPRPKKITNWNDEILRKQSKNLKQRLQLMMESQLEMGKMKNGKEYFKRPHKKKAVEIPKL